MLRWAMGSGLILLVRADVDRHLDLMPKRFAPCLSLVRFGIHLAHGALAFFAGHALSFRSSLAFILSGCQNGRPLDVWVLVLRFDSLSSGHGVAPAFWAPEVAR